MYEINIPLYICRIYYANKSHNVTLYKVSNSGQVALCFLSLM